MQIANESKRKQTKANEANEQKWLMWRRLLTLTKEWINDGNAWNENRQLIERKQLQCKRNAHGAIAAFRGKSEHSLHPTI